MQLKKKAFLKIIVCLLVCVQVTTIFGQITFQNTREDGAARVELYNLDGEIFASQYIPRGAYTISKDGIATEIKDEKVGKVSVETIFKRGDTYVIKEKRGGEVVSTDLKTWTRMEDRMILNKDGTTSTGNKTSYYYLDMSNTKRIGNTLFLIGEGNSTGILCVNDQTREGGQKIKYNSVGLTIKKNGKDVEIASVPLTVSTPGNGDTKGQSDRLVVGKDAEGTTTIHFFNVGVGRVKDVQYFKENLLLVQGEDGVAILEEKQNLGSTEYIFKSRHLFKQESVKSIGCVKALNDRIFISEFRKLSWSIDGVKWESMQFPSFNGAAGIKDIAYGNGMYMLITHSRDIWYSRDLKNWEQTKLPDEQEQQEEIAFTGERFIIPSFKGGLWVSEVITIKNK